MTKKNTNVDGRKSLRHGFDNLSRFVLIGLAGFFYYFHIGLHSEQS